MKCLLLHCKQFSYKLDHPTPIAETSVEKKEANYENPMVLFIAFESTDEEGKINSAASDISSLATTVGATSIVINPFAHLSSSLAKPAKAKELAKKLLIRLKEITNMEVIYTSFGWYKSFLLDVYGHDNSQVFREY